ncbi:MAG: HAD family hydrolase [Deltaproteobacteria bacterium]|nr:HAD family hydrolase [Deltaproteobacteria bacterium]
MSAQKLAIFDIDGTLTNTNAADEHCFQKTVSSVFKIGKVSTDWSAYKHSTDSGILYELIERELKIKPAVEDLAHFKEFFVQACEEVRNQNPSAFFEIPGASKLFPHLLGSAGWKVAIATGAWKPSALFKLAAGGIPFEDIPAAFAEDAFERKMIVQTAQTRAKEVYGVSAFDKVVYVGDGTWDLKASRECAIGFIGIGSQSKGEKLKAAGVKDIFFDYHDLPKFISALESVCS